MENKEQINLLAYTYDADQTTEIPALALMELIQFAKAVATQEEVVGLSYKYSTKTKEKKDKDFLIAVEENNVEYPTAESFFNQEPKTFISMLGAGAQDLLLKLQNVHLQNIEKGIAKPVPTGEFQPAKA